jgi:hypothetical protein
VMSLLILDEVVVWGRLMLLLMRWVLRIHISKIIYFKIKFCFVEILGVLGFLGSNT